MRILPAFIAAALLTACSSRPSSGHRSTDPETPETLAEQIERKVAGFINNGEAFFLSGNGEQVFVTAKSSRIIVPAKSFERLDGSSPLGKVKLVFKEYQTAGEILASGLPMTYTDPSGKTIQFESAGMFEIRAYDDKEELRLKKGKEITVDLATPSDGKYNFYTLNDNTRAWSETAKNLSPEPNRYIAEQQQRLSELEGLTSDKPKTPVPYKPSDKVFDIKVDGSKYPEFAELGGVMWKYVGTEKKDDPAENLSVFKKRYAFMRMLPKPGNELVYAVEFCSPKDTITLDLAPVFPGKLGKRNEQRLKEKLAKFNAALKEQEKLRSQGRNESALLRRFNVDKLGIYNYDRQFKDDNFVPVAAEFTFAGRSHDDYPEAGVYLIPEGKLAVIRYTPETAKLFAINPYEKNQLIAVVGDGEVFALSDRQIRSLELERSKGKKKVIDLKSIDKPAKTGKDLDNILAGL